MTARTTPAYDLFWENSKLASATIQSFRRRLDDYAVVEREPEPLVFPAASVRLARPRDRLARLTAARRSDRAFTDAPLSFRRVGRLLAAFATGAIPSAGALRPLEVFCLLERVEGGPGRVVAHYESFTHGLTPIGPLPAWSDYRETLNLDGFTGIPPLVVVLVLRPDRLTEKYGERGGRFGLIEVGHAAQSLALRLSAERLAGCEVGGVLDDAVARLLGLSPRKVQVALGYACGICAKR